MAEVFAGADEGGQNFVHQMSVRPSRQGSHLRLAHFGRGDHLHALVIWAVFLTDLMRRRMSRVLGIRYL